MKFVQLIKLENAHVPMGIGFLGLHVPYKYTYMCLRVCVRVCVCVFVCVRVRVHVICLKSDIWNVKLQDQGFVKQGAGGIHPLCIILSS